MAEDIKPRGRPKKNPKYTWQVTSEGIIPVEVRFHQGNYKTFKYENGKTTMLKTVNTPLFDSLEEANSNAPKFEGFTKSIKDTRGAPRKFPGKYGYTITPDNKIIIEEYRFFTGSGTAKEGYRNVSFDEKGATTKGKLFDGELFDTPDEAINNYKTNYSGGKKIDWETFEDSLDTGEYVNTGDYINEDLADGDMMNAQYDSEIEIPDTVPEDLVDEVDRERLREFLELQEPEGTVLYDDAEVAEQAEANRRSRLTPQESDEFVNIVNQYNNQLDNVLDNVPIEKAVKKRIRNKTAELSARLFTPGGPLIDALDFYETAVFGLGMIIAAAPELKNIASYYSTLAANHIGKAYGMNIPVDKLEPDWERINKVMDQVEAVTPTDILINKVMDREQKGNTYVSSYLPGFLPQSTIKNDDVSTTLEKTLMNMPINKGKTETSSDKLKESLIYGSTK